MPKNILEFPDILSLIYEETESVDNIRSKYIDLLRKDASMHNILYANKLQEATDILQKSNLKEFEHLIHDFKEFMRDGFCKKNRTSVRLMHRQKDFVRLNNKIRHKLIKNQPLDTVRDLLGFRIILNTPPKDSEDTVNLCYKVLDEVINFFVIEKCGIPLEADVLKPSNFVQEEHPDILVPTKSGVPQELKLYVKDYIFFIKEKGYQSLHIVIQLNGLKFEIQIRTFAMDVVAEKGSASHLGYEDERKEPSDIILDYSKVQLPGFCYLPSGERYDMSGLDRAIDPINTLL